MVTVPPDSVAVTWPLATAEAQAPCSASTWASLTSVTWSSGAVAVNQLLYWLSIELIRARIV